MYSTLFASSSVTTALYRLLNTGVVKRVGARVHEAMTSKFYIGMSLLNGAITIHISSNCLSETLFNYLKFIFNFSSATCGLIVEMLSIIYLPSTFLRGPCKSLRTSSAGRRSEVEIFCATSQL
jgi:hypothetical protein